MARLVVVGSGTVVPEADRGCSCFFVEMEGARILLDCGPGVLQGVARYAIPWSRLTDLILTHFHADHVGGLPGLFFALKHATRPGKRDQPLDVWGPPGTRRLFEKLADALGAFLRDPGCPLQVRDIAPGDSAELRSGIVLRTFKTSHTAESHGVRLDGAVVSVGYTGDTSPCASLGTFMRAVSLLVCECSFLDGEVGGHHLSPTGVAQIAQEAQPGRLLLTHVYPHVRESHDVAALVRAAGYRREEVLVAHDGLVLELAD